MNVGTMGEHPVSGDNEMRDYLRYILNHSANCRIVGCASCLILSSVCEQLRHQIFSGPVFPEVMTCATSRAS
jgi:hypothetical protein